MKFDLLKEAVRLIRLHSETVRSNAALARHVGGLLRRLGARVQYQSATIDGQRFLNVLGVFGEGSRPLLLNAHLDTVVSGDRRRWTKTGGDPYRATIRGGTLYGLGAVDTKLDLVCKLAALSQLGRIRRPVMVLGTFGEERGLLGAKRFCQKLSVKPIAALVGEPTELRIVRQHKGYAVYRVRLRAPRQWRPRGAREIMVKGKAAHSSQPALGINAIERAIQLMDRNSWIVDRMEGGTAANIIPAECRLWIVEKGARPLLKGPGPFFRVLWALKRLRVQWARLPNRAFDPPVTTSSITQIESDPRRITLTCDLRILPDQSPERVLEEIERAMSQALGRGVHWRFEVDRVNPPFVIDPQADIVRLVQQAQRRLRLPTALETKAGCSEAGVYQQHGIPSVVLGPGRSTGNAHQPNEWVTVRQLQLAVDVYREILQQWGRPSR